MQENNKKEENDEKRGRRKIKYRCALQSHG